MVARLCPFYDSFPPIKRRRVADFADNFSEIPQEIKDYIFSLVGLKAINNMRLTCQAWHRSLHDNCLFWKSKCQALKVDVQVFKGESSKSLFLKAIPKITSLPLCNLLTWNDALNLSIELLGANNSSYKDVYRSLCYYHGKPSAITSASLIKSLASTLFKENLSERMRKYFTLKLLKYSFYQVSHSEEPAYSPYESITNSFEIAFGIENIIKDNRHRDRKFKFYDLWLNKKEEHYQEVYAEFYEKGFFKYAQKVLLLIAASLKRKKNNQHVSCLEKVASHPCSSLRDQALAEYGVLASYFQEPNDQLRPDEVFMRLEALKKSYVLDEVYQHQISFYQAFLGYQRKVHFIDDSQVFNIFEKTAYCLPPSLLLNNIQMYQSIMVTQRRVPFLPYLDYIAASVFKRLLGDLRATQQQIDFSFYYLAILSYRHRQGLDEQLMARVFIATEKMLFLTPEEKACAQIHLEILTCQRLGFDRVWESYGPNAVAVFKKYAFNPLLEGYLEQGLAHYWLGFLYYNGPLQGEDSPICESHLNFVINHPKMVNTLEYMDALLMLCGLIAQGKIKTTDNAPLVKKIYDVAVFSLDWQAEGFSPQWIEKRELVILALTSLLFGDLTGALNEEQVIRVLKNFALNKNLPHSQAQVMVQVGLLENNYLNSDEIKDFFSASASGPHISQLKCNFLKFIAPSKSVL